MLMRERDGGKELGEVEGVQVCIFKMWVGVGYQAELMTDTLTLDY